MTAIKTGDNAPSETTLHTIRRVTWVGFWVNAFLMALKLFFGFYGHSDALVADGVHSLSDFATDLIVLVFVGIAYKGADRNYPYGHGKFETFASLLIGGVLLIIAISIGIEAVKCLVRAAQGEILPRPDVWTIIVALAAILGKEILARYTYAKGRKVKSSALLANAGHHRSDAISSIATLIGVSASYFLGEAWRVLDPVASVVISVFIGISAVQISNPSVNELLERALPPEQVNRVAELIKHVNGVKGMRELRTRRNGHSRIFDLSILVNPNLTVSQGHDIASAVERTLRREFGNDSYINVHVEPYGEAPAPPPSST